MRANQLVPLASALLAAVVAMLLLLIQTLEQIEEPWNIVVVSQMATLARTTFLAALAHTVGLGLPLFLLLRSKWHVGVVACALGGFLVGAAPLGALGLIALFGLESASIDGVPAVVNHVPTLTGLVKYVQEVGLIGLFGAAGGLTFWTAMRLAGQSSAATIKALNQSSQTRASSWGVVSLAALLACTILFIPSMASDNSCHNLFRDGRTSAVPQISAEIKLSAEDWPALTSIFIDVGAAHSMLFRDDQMLRGGATSICATNPGSTSMLSMSRGSPTSIPRLLVEACDSVFTNSSKALIGDRWSAISLTGSTQRGLKRLHFVGRMESVLLLKRL